MFQLGYFIFFLAKLQINTWLRRHQPVHRKENHTQKKASMDFFFRPFRGRHGEIPPRPHRSDGSAWSHWKPVQPVGRAPDASGVRGRQTEKKKSAEWFWFSRGD